MSKVRLALIGTGYIAQAEHIPSILNCKDCELVALVDPRPRLLKALGERLKVQVYPTLCQALNECRFDAVDICAGPLVHADLIKEAAMAEKHILVEKPFTHSVTQAESALKVVEEHGVKLMVGYMRRFDDDVLRVKKLIEDGKVGRIQSILTLFKLVFKPFYIPVIDPVDDDIPVMQETPTDPVDLLPADQIINQSIHHLNLIRFLGGEIAGVTAVQKTKQICNILFRMKSGALGNHCHAGGMGNGEEFWVFGDNGSIHTKLWSPHLPYQFPETVHYDQAASVESRLVMPRLNPYQNEIDAFVNWIRSGGTNPASGEDAICDLKVIEKIHEAIKSTKEILVQ
jgi:predicted dehydrogenase